MEKEKKGIKVKRITLFVIILFILFLTGNVFAALSGNNNIFFVIKDLVTEKNVEGKDELLTDRDESNIIKDLQVKDEEETQIENEEGKTNSDDENDFVINFSLEDKLNTIINVKDFENVDELEFDQKIYMFAKTIINYNYEMPLIKNGEKTTSDKLSFSKSEINSVLKEIIGSEIEEFSDIKKEYEYYIEEKAGNYITNPKDIGFTDPVERVKNVKKEEKNGIIYVTCDSFLSIASSDDGEYVSSYEFTVDSKDDIILSKKTVEKTYEEIKENLLDEDYFKVENIKDNRDGTYTLIGEIRTLYKLTDSEMKNILNTNIEVYGNSYSIIKGDDLYEYYLEDESGEHNRYGIKADDSGEYSVVGLAQISRVWKETGEYKQITVSGDLVVDNEYSDVTMTAKELFEDIENSTVKPHFGSGLMFDFENGECKKITCVLTSI